MATVADQLAEAEAAYHELALGRTPRVVLDQNGEKVEFVAANRQQLYLYIQQLRAQVSTAAGTPVMPAPAGFLF